MTSTRDFRIDLLVTEEQHVAFEAAAKKLGFVSTSEWIRVTLTLAATNGISAATYPCGAYEACKLKSKVPSIAPPAKRSK